MKWSNFEWTTVKKNHILTILNKLQQSTGIQNFSCGIYVVIYKIKSVMKTVFHRGTKFTL